MAFQVSYKLKDSFFDRKKIIDKIGKARVRILSKFGAFVRRRARSSLRRRKKVSAAGQPPSVHSRDSVATLKNILFGLEPDKLSVLIGPVGLHGSRSQPVPATLEYGGTVRLRERPRKRSSAAPAKVRTVKYAPRPFMFPALKTEAPKFPQLWVGTVTE